MMTVQQHRSHLLTTPRFRRLEGVGEGEFEMRGAIRTVVSLWPLIER